MKYTVYATPAVLEHISGRNALFLIKTFGFDYWRRRESLTVQGNKVIIATALETRKKKFTNAVEIGGVDA